MSAGCCPYIPQMMERCTGSPGNVQRWPTSTPKTVVSQNAGGTSSLIYSGCKSHRPSLSFSHAGYNAAARLTLYESQSNTNGWAKSGYERIYQLIQYFLVGAGPLGLCDGK